MLTSNSRCADPTHTSRVRTVLMRAGGLRCSRLFDAAEARTEVDTRHGPRNRHARMTLIGRRY